MLVPSISIQNKNGVAMLIDEEDLGLLTQHKDGYWYFCVDRGYVVIVHKKSRGGNGNKIGFHRLIMGDSVGMEVSHVNGNKLDNRRENLRLCTRGQHRLNTIGYGSSKFKGVHKCHGFARWQASIWTNKVRIYLGTFDTEIEAALAFDAAARRFPICEFRLLNFPDEVPSA